MEPVAVSSRHLRGQSQAVCCRLLAIAVFLASGRAALGGTPAPAPDAVLLADAVRAGWIRVSLVSGRIQVAGSRVGLINPYINRNGSTEQLTVQSDDAVPTVAYELSSSREELRFHVDGAQGLRLSRKPKNDTAFAAIEFRQPFTGPVSLAVGAGSEQRMYEAASLWHLLFAAPGACRHDLLPVLRSLNPQWNLDALANDVEESLIASAKNGLVPDRRRWDELVAQLGDPRFARREAADRQLRGCGRIVAVYLQQLDRGELDAEQDYRVRRILASLALDTTDDAPEQVALWLAGDRAVWLALLERDDPATRRLAAVRLETLTGRRVAFNPDADASIRVDQLARLRLQPLFR
jgi:hypothetical protein